MLGKDEGISFENIVHGNLQRQNECKVNKWNDSYLSQLTNLPR
jgi:hypothetical protein